ncbi:MAG: hypothetical protein HZA54_19155 [Planctomycetes bacterium]|nr:hypothetical protein [Planctomycetota bacterium]
MTGRDSPNPERCFEEWWLHGSPRQVEKLLRETDAARPVAERLREHYAGRTDVYPPFLTSDPGPGAARSPLAPIPSTACLLPLGLALLLGLAGLVWFVRFLLS